jgi:hypothetical protein
MMKKAITLPSSLLIDPSMEPLQEILAPYRGITHVPSELDGPALMVFIELQKCFQKAGKVCEGLLPNIIWGFENCGYDPKHVASGLTKLRHLNYIYYSDAGRQPVSEYFFDPAKPVWIRYSDKFTALLVKGEHDGRTFGESTSSPPAPTP